MALLVAGVPSQAGDPQPGLAPLFRCTAALPAPSPPFPNHAMHAPEELFCISFHMSVQTHILCHPKTRWPDLVGCELHSSRELQELLDWERTTTLLAMHNEEATAATAGGGPSDDAAVCTHETPTNSDGYVML